MIWRNDTRADRRLRRRLDVARRPPTWARRPGYVRRISALGISTANSPNVLYYGTIDGIVMKAAEREHRHAHSGQHHAAGFERRHRQRADSSAASPWTRRTPIAPWWRSGTTTSRASGTRRTAARTGRTSRAISPGPSGPSIRWATMFYIDGQLQVFLGTSIGVLSTTVADGRIYGLGAGGRRDDRQRDRGLHGLPAVGPHARRGDPRRGVFTTQFVPVTAVGDEPAAGPERVAWARAIPIRHEPGRHHHIRASRAERGLAPDLRRVGPRRRGAGKWAARARSPCRAGRHRAPRARRVLLRAEGGRGEPDETAPRRALAPRRACGDQTSQLKGSRVV